MKLRREESTGNVGGVTEAERQRMRMQQELHLIRLRSQAQFLENRNESYYQQMERRKVQFTQWHQATKYSFDEKLEKGEVFNKNTQ
jgi:hypothetical protein